VPPRADRTPIGGIDFDIASESKRHCAFVDGETLSIRLVPNPCGFAASIDNLEAMGFPSPRFLRSGLVERVVEHFPDVATSLRVAG